MCKHVAAVLYGIGSRLDVKPELLFLLRAVNEKDLVADIGQSLPLSKRGPAAGKVLEADDMAALFGLDMGIEAPDGVGGDAVRLAPRDERRAIAREGSDEAVRKVPAKRTARTAGASSKPVARAKPAASEVVTARQAAALVTRVGAVSLKVRQTAGQPAKTAPVPALSKPAGKAATARKKARNQPASMQEPVQWWVEGWNGRMP
jgi:uncharacterized Zn finger protein